MDFHPILLCPKKNIEISVEGLKNGVTNLPTKNPLKPTTPSPAPENYAFILNSFSGRYFNLKFIY